MKIRKPNIKKIKEELDILFALIVRLAGKCQRCGSIEKLQCSHIFSRSNLSVRWDLENAFCLCSGCHIFWWHKNPIEASEFTRDKIGEIKYQQLRFRAISVKKWTFSELVILKSKLKSIWESKIK